MYAGIEPDKYSRWYYYCLIDSSLEINSIGKGSVEHVLSLLSSDEVKGVGIAAPPSPNSGTNVYQQKSLSNELEPSPQMRGVEQVLYDHEAPVYRTSSEYSDCAKWMQRGFDLYKRLSQIGYIHWLTDTASQWWIETPSDACFWSIIRSKILPANTLRGRIQRQIILHDLGFEIFDPMVAFEEITRFRLMQGIFPFEKIQSGGELNTLIAAYTALMVDTDFQNVEQWGNSAIGEVFLPGKPRKKY